MNEGQKNLIYKNKKQYVYFTPAFNFDEVCEIPEWMQLLLSSDKD